MLRLSRGWLIASLIILLWAASTAAHQQKAAITEVFFNPRTGNIEVAHRFLMHDAEHAVRLLFDPKADIINNEETQARFASYAAAGFSMAALGSDEELPLTTLGYEVERQWIWVYQEIEIPDDLKGLSIRQLAMTDLWNDQYNTVNVKRDDAIQTLTFLGRRPPQSVEF